MSIQNYRTPPEIFQLAQSLFGEFDLDAAADETDALTWFIDDAFTGEWCCQDYPASAVWCNPPYSDTEAWVNRAIAQCIEEKVCRRVVMLIPVNTGVSYWKTIYEHATAICMINGRISFINPETGQRDGGNRHDSCFVVFDSNKIPGQPVFNFMVDNPQKGKRRDELERLYPDQRETGSADGTNRRTERPGEIPVVPVKRPGIQVVRRRAKTA